jgi:RNA polymerase sigma-70 factor (ECF subfamily)
MTQTNTLVYRIAQGDLSAQLQFYRETADAVYATAFNLLQNAGAAEDVLHDTYIKAFEKIAQLKHPDRPVPWLKQIARHLALKELRRQQRLNDLSQQESLLFEAEASDANHLPHIEVGELREAMDRLPDGYRVVLYLHLIEEMKHEEIAEELGLAPASVRSQYHRGRKKLMNELKIHL